jgi:hypothetical protein
MDAAGAAKTMGFAQRGRGVPHKHGNKTVQNRPVGSLNPRNFAVKLGSRAGTGSRPVHPNILGLQPRCGLELRSEGRAYLQPRD